MTPAQFQRVEELFHRCRDTPPEQRERLLDQACGDDSEVRAVVGRILAHADPDESLTDLREKLARVLGGMAPVGSSTVTLVQFTEPAQAPKQIGHYRIIGKIGEGGMGTVYEARQEKPDRTVALKIMNARFASDRMRFRFEHEVEVLGRLQHPGIAQIFEAGTFDPGSGPQPFFAMELIKGKPLTAWADEHELGTRQRLELMSKVCDAVEHAHQKGVIHRDLKPGNILVDESGQPKILDFGVARATGSDLQSNTLRTDVGQIVGTVPYMSPEQAGGKPDELDTRSDVYALGVVTYELLTGSLPYDLRDKPLHEALRIVCEVDPTPASSINRVLRGDLDWITMKCLEKDRARRYPSADALAADIGRYLDDQPVMARGPSFFYHFSKFVRRRRLPLGVAAVLVVAVMLTTYSQLHATKANLTAATQTAQRLYLDAQFGALWRKRHDPDWQAALEAAMSECHRAIEIEPDLPEAYAVSARLSFLQGDMASAHRDAQAALELDPDLSLALRTLGLLYQLEGRFEPALDNYDRGMRDGEAIAQDYHNRGILRRIAGQYQLALEDHNRAVSLEPNETMAYQGRGLARYFVGDINGAIEDFSKAAALQPKSPTAMEMNIWIWELRMLRDASGDRAAAPAALAEAANAVGDLVSAALLDVCGGRKTIDEVLPGLTPPGVLDSEIECIVSYCAAIKALIDDHPADAKFLFQRCRQTKAILQPEYDLADWHLKQLAAK